VKKRSSPWKAEVVLKTWHLALADRASEMPHHPGRPIRLDYFATQDKSSSPGSIYSVKAADAQEVQENGA
jgi:hypothetical protein